LVNITVVNHTGCRNKGCEALLYGTLKMFNEIYEGKVKFKVFTGDIEYDEKMIKKFSGIRYFNDKNIVLYKTLRIHGLCKYIYLISLNPIACKCLSKISFKDISNKAAIFHQTYGRDTDLVVSIGGDMFSQEYGPVALDDCINKVTLAQRRKIPTLILANSIGKFDHKKSVSRVKKMLGKSLITTVREPETFDYLKEIGCKGSNIYLTADMAFLMEKSKSSSILSAIDLDPGKLNIGLGISSGIAKFLKMNPDAYLDQMADLIKSILNHYKNSVVYLLPHVFEKSWDDASACREVYKRVNSERCRDLNGSLNMSGLSASEIKLLISKFDLFIGARTHSVIAAIDSDVPSIVLSYSIKSEGIMKYLYGDEYKKYIVNYSDNCITDLLARINRIISNISSEKITVSTKVIMLRERSEKNFDIINQHINALHSV